MKLLWVHFVQSAAPGMESLFTRDTFPYLGAVALVVKTTEHAWSAAAFAAWWRRRKKL